LYYNYCYGRYNSPHNLNELLKKYFNEFYGEYSGSNKLHISPVELPIIDIIEDKTKTIKEKNNLCNEYYSSSVCRQDLTLNKSSYTDILRTIFNNLTKYIDNNKETIYSEKCVNYIYEMLSTVILNYGRHFLYMKNLINFLVIAVNGSTDDKYIIIKCRDVPESCIKDEILQCDFYTCGRAIQKLYNNDKTKIIIYNTASPDDDYMDIDYLFAEGFAGQLTDSKESELPIGGSYTYYDKYIKYKNKYIKLKHQKNLRK
jgi:hypothetical protein